MNKGYIIIQNFLSTEEHQKLLHTCKTLYDEATNNKNNEHYEWDEQGQLNKINYACANNKAFKDLANNDILVYIAKNIIQTQDTLDCYISKFFPMQPKTGTSTFMHQDNYYFQGDNKKILSCAVYLTDTRKENGCLRLAEDSHKNGIIPHEITSNINKYVKWIDNSRLTEYDIVDLELKAPYAVMFDINLVHGCYQNTSNDFRYSLAWEYIESSNDTVRKCDRIKLH
tara:strand:- start:45256 stop:45936 length:681 start_codon:yes stop_codon:yes gene_type:complete